LPPLSIKKMGKYKGEILLLHRKEKKKTQERWGIRGESLFPQKKGEEGLHLRGGGRGREKRKRREICSDLRGKERKKGCLLPDRAEERKGSNLGGKEDLFSMYSRTREGPLR